MGAKPREIAVLTDAPDVPVTHASPLVNVLNVLVSRPDLDVDKIERMIQLQRDVEANEARKAYASAFAEMQPHLPIITKRGKGHNDKAYGLWEDIVEEVMPVTGRYGFSISFRTKPLDKGVEVTCKLMHRDGHAEETSYPFPLDTSGSKNPVQAVGSTVSYGKRYTACAMLNIVTKGEDDDGKSSGGGDRITDDQQEHLKALLAEAGGEIEKFLAYAKAASFAEIRSADYGKLESLLRKKGQRS
jgi:hypothetical protein